MCLLSWESEYFICRGKLNEEAKKISLKWIGFIIFTWVILLFLGATFEGHTQAAGDWEGTTEATKLELLTNIKNVTYAHGETGTLAWVTPNPEYFKTLGEVLSWDFTFLRGSGFEIVRWVVLIPFTMAALFGLIYVFITLLQGFISR